MPASFKNKKKGSIVAGSPAIQEHEAMMEEVNNDDRYNEPEKSEPSRNKVSRQSVAKPKNSDPNGVFSQFSGEDKVNVQTRVPVEIYAKMNNLILQAKIRKQKLSIGEIVYNAIVEYLDNH